MNRFFTILLAASCLTAVGQVDFGPVSVELDTSFAAEPDGGPYDELAGYKSYIAYFEADDPTDALVAIWSDTLVYPELEILAINAPCGCWNPIDASMVLDNNNSSFSWTVEPLWQYDTFWTIGKLSSDMVGDNPSWLSSPMVFGEAICNTEVTNGSAYVIGTPLNAVAGDDYRIPIARITTCGSFTISGNLLIYRGGSSYMQEYQSFHQTVSFDGCTDSSACNFDVNAAEDDGSCLYLDEFGICGGLCTVDNDNNGVCDDQEIYGCTYSQAENYLPEATRDDGSCLLGEGCNPVCDLEYDGNGDGSVGSGDLLGLLTEFGAECTPETAFTCGNPVSYQGYDYETVQIGEQCWFAENLRAENYRNGDVIPAGLSDSEWENTTLGAIAVYGEGSSQCFSYSPNGDACDEVWSLTEYGRLYNWYAVDDSRGLCPSEWHIPSDEELMTMEIFLGMSESDANSTGWRGTDQGIQLRSVYELCSGTNSSGFSGLLGGFRYPYGSFSSGGSAGYWWSSTPIGESAWERYILCDDQVFRYGANQKAGFSIRCIKDSE